MADIQPQDDPVDDNDSEDDDDFVDPVEADIEYEGTVSKGLSELKVVKMQRNLLLNRLHTLRPSLNIVGFEP